MHGVGLLRISCSPVTVDTEEYVVFVEGYLVPQGFGSWIEANACFLEHLEFKKVRAQKRLLSGVDRRRGARPGEKAYWNGLRVQEKTR